MELIYDPSGMCFLFPGSLRPVVNAKCSQSDTELVLDFIGVMSYSVTDPLSQFAAGS